MKTYYLGCVAPIELSIATQGLKIQQNNKGIYMDEAIKKEKKSMDKGMDKLASMDKKRDKACDAGMKMKKKKKK